MLKVRTEDLRHLQAPERERRIGELVDAACAPRNGQQKVLDASIRELESRYEMSSADMLAKFARGDVSDTADVSRWIILLRASGRR